MNVMPVVPIVMCTSLLCGCLSLGASPARPVPQTDGFQPDSTFHFTISPDDRWIVFFKGLTPEQIGTRDNQHGNLCVLDRQEQTLQTIIVGKDIAPRHLANADASWAPDSSLCVLPPPNPGRDSNERGVMIDLRTPQAITIERVTVQNAKNPGVRTTSDAQLKMFEFTCSDCSQHLNDLETVKQYIPGEVLDRDDVPWDKNQFGLQIMSLDGTKILFQKGHHSEEVSLFCYDIATKQERELTSHKGDCVIIERMRPSPDGKSLAYQVVTGCDFVSDGAVWVINLATGDREQVGVSSGGTMHWTSTSDRLYFYRDNALWVAEFGPPVPATRPAATSPATAPAR